MKPFTIYTADTIQNAQNKLYPHGHYIENLDQLTTATQYDHTPAFFQRATRANENFLESNVIVMDLDNTHTNKPGYHKTINDIKTAFPDVRFYYIYSRNHQREKVKGGETYAPRLKVHIYFPLTQTYTRENLDKLQTLKRCTAGLFPFFDHAAIDAGRFFFGADRGGGAVEGSACLDDFLRDKAKAGTLQGAMSQALANAEYEAAAAGETWDEIGQWRRELEPLIAIPTSRQASQSTSGSLQSMDLPRNLTEEQKDKCLFAERFLNRHNLFFERVEQGNYTHYFIHCPWAAEHTEPDRQLQAKISILPKDDGGAAIKYICRHAHCSCRGWKDLKALYEPQDAPQAPQSHGETPEDKKYDEGHKEAYRALRSFTEGPDQLAAFYDAIQTETYKPIRTGLKCFDDAIGDGIMPQTLCTIVAAPGIGKTTLCMQLAEMMAVKCQPSIYINLEMSRNQMLAKAFSYQLLKRYNMRMEALEVMQGYRWTDEQNQAIDKLMTAYRTEVWPYLRYNPAELGNDLDKIINFLDVAAEQARSDGRKAPAAFIDYLHLITSKGAEDKQELIKRAVTELKGYAVRNNTFCIVVAAKNRNANDNRITLESGRDSSAIEYGGDYQIGLNYYDCQYNNKTPEEAKDASPTYRHLCMPNLKARWADAYNRNPCYFYSKCNTFYGPDEFIPADPDFIPFKAAANQKKAARNFKSK